MEIEKIGHNRLQIHVTSDDLLEREMDIKDLWQNGPRAQQLFWEIVTMAYDKYGFIVEDGMVLVEAIGLIPDGVIVILTKPGQVDDYKPPQTERRPRERSRGRMRRTSPRDLVFCFADFEDVVQSLPFLSEYLDLESHLYHYQEAYYLHLRLYGSQRRFAKRILTILSEFSGRGEYGALVLKEYGKIILSGSALRSLTVHFAT